MQYANYEILQKYGIDTKNIYEKNKNRKVIYGISIDNNTTSFYDDGISLFRKNGNYILQISITDTTECIPFGSSLDIKARKILLDNEKIFLFPLKVKNSCLGLKKDQVNLTFTIEIVLNHKLEILSRRFFKSAFVNRKSYSYNSFDEELKRKNYLKDSTVYKLSSFTEKLYFKVNNVLKKLNADEIVECLMGFTNKQVALYCNENNIPVIYHNKLPKCENKYTLTNTEYTTFTSPMRKYTDIITHLQIKSYLESGNNAYPLDRKRLEKIVYELNTLNCMQNNNNFARELIQKLINSNSYISTETIERILPTLEREKVDPFVVFYILYYLNSEENIKQIIIQFFKRKINKMWSRALYAFIKYNTNLEIELDISTNKSGKRYREKKSANRNSTIYLKIDNKVFEFTQKRKTNEQLSSKAMEMLFSKLYKYIHDYNINIFENI